MAKVALVTGTSTGLGQQISVQLAKKGFKTYATMRNLAKKDKLMELAAEEGVSLEAKQLDVQDAASVNKCVEEILAAEGRLDVLVNNAGAGYVRSTEQATEEDIKWILDVNLMGVIRCTKAVIPHMRERKEGRIINIASVGGLVGQPFNEIYCAAKFGVEGYTEAMACYVQPTFNIKFTVIEPGGISSEFATSALSHLQSTGGMLEDEYKPILEKYVAGASRRGGADSDLFQTPAEVAGVVLDCIEAEDPPIRKRTSKWGEDMCQLKTGLDPTGEKMQAKAIEYFLG